MKYLFQNSRKEGIYMFEENNFLIKFQVLYIFQNQRVVIFIGFLGIFFDKFFWILFFIYIFNIFIKYLFYDMFYNKKWEQKNK